MGREGSPSDHKPQGGDGSGKARVSGGVGAAAVSCTRRRLLRVAAGGEGEGPYRILLKSGEAFAFAGIWQEGAEGVPGFAIITTAANPLVSHIHDRMPAIMAGNEERPWLEDWLSEDQARAMLRPYEGAAMDAYSVSTIVNSPANDTPAVLRKAA